MEPRIALLNAAHDPAGNRRNFRRELDATLVEYHPVTGDLPETFDFDGFVVTGSRSSVYDDEPWIADLREWVSGALDRDLPALGVCFGHQLLAAVLGGRVEGMGEYEIGYRTVEHDGSNRLLAGVPEEFTAFTTHSDRVVELPPGAEPFAENDYGLHGFRHGHAFAVQFHPEYDVDTAREVTTGKEDQLGSERVREVVDGITEENYRAACEAKTLFDNFVAYVRDHAVDDPVAGGEPAPAGSPAADDGTPTAESAGTDDD